MPRLLHDEVAGEPIGRLHDDGVGPIAGYVLEHGGKARARIQGVRTTDGLIIVFAHELVGGTLGESCNGLALALVTVLVGTDVGGRAGAQYAIAGVLFFLDIVPIRQCFLACSR